MKKIVLLLITASMLLALFGCAKQKPASVVESTTEPTGTITEASGKKATIDRALFDNIVCGKTTKAEYLDIVRGYEYEDYIRGRNVNRFKCTDGGYIYVEFTYSFEHGEVCDVNVIVNTVSEEYTIPVHDRTLFDQITVGMYTSDMLALLGGDPGTRVTSGLWVAEYLLNDGSRAYVVFNGKNPFDSSCECFCVGSVSIEEPTNE